MPKLLHITSLQFVYFLLYIPVVRNCFFVIYFLVALISAVCLVLVLYNDNFSLMRDLIFANSENSVIIDFTDWKHLRTKI